VVTQEGPLLPSSTVGFAAAGAFIAGLAGRRWFEAALRPRPLRAVLRNALVRLVLFGQPAVFALAFLFATPLDAPPTLYVGAALGVMTVGMFASVSIVRMVLRPASARGAAAVAKVAARLAVTVQPVSIPLDGPNWFAIPGLRAAGFTARAEELFDDDELEAAALQAVHLLTGPRAAGIARTLLHWISYLILALTGLAFAQWGMLGIVATMVAFIVCTRLRFRSSRSALQKADRASAGPAYARALLLMAEENLTPLVTKASTHPSTYDRLVEAGAPPPFPRPAPPTPPDGLRVPVWIGLVGVFVALFSIRDVVPEELSGGRAETLLVRARDADLPTAERYVVAAVSIDHHLRWKGVEVLGARNDCDASPRLLDVTARLCLRMRR
jgi:hypothetical protein